jgi:AraC-like DNA-binding protein
MYPEVHVGSQPSAVPAIAGLDASLPRFLAERHYTVKEVATLWNLSQSKVRELFAEEAGTIRFGKPTRRVGSRRRRGYFTTRIPESALLRLHRRLTSAGWYSKLATEQHYTPQQLAEVYGLSDTMVRRMFAEEGGVLRVGEPSRRVGRKLTRRMYAMRIPETVAQRVYDQRVKKPCSATH